MRLGDRKDAAVLEELEHVLLEVANAPDAPTKQDTKRVQQRIAQNELLIQSADHMEWMRGRED